MDHAIASVDLLLACYPKSERPLLNNGFTAASIVHVFNPAILAAVLQTDENDAVRISTALNHTPFVRRSADVSGAARLEQSYRVALRHRLATQQGEVFRLFSSRAADYYSRIQTEAAKTEAVYHWISAESPNADVRLQERTQELCDFAERSEIHFLAATMSELLVTAAGRLRVEILLCLAEAASVRADSIDHLLASSSSGQTVKPKLLV